MTRTVVQQTDASVTLAGSGTWNTNADFNASGGSFAVNASSGATASIAVPTTAKTVHPMVRFYHNGSPLVSVYLDGVLQYTASVNNGTTQTSANFWFYRALLPPIVIPTPGAGHTILISNGASQGLSIDGYEWYTADAKVAGRLTIGGSNHSWASGYLLAAPASQRYGALIAAGIGMTEENFAIPNQDMTNGRGGTAAGYNNWSFAAVGATAGTVQLTVIVNGNAQTTATPLNFNDTKATVLAAIQGLSNVGAAQCALNAGSGATINAAGGVTVVFQGTLATTDVIVIPTIGTAFAPSPASDFHITLGNPQYQNNGNDVPGWMIAEAGYGTWSRDPDVYVTIAGGVNELGVYTLYDTGSVPLSIPAAGAGYGKGRYIQRKKEELWRVKANCPTAELWVVTSAPSLTGDTAANRAMLADMNAALRTVAADPTINANVCDIATVLGIANGGAQLYTTDHPNLIGHRLIADAFLASYRAAHPEKYGQAALALR
jgi:hypothetical protein